MSKSKLRFFAQSQGNIEEYNKMRTYNCPVQDSGSLAVSKVTAKGQRSVKNKGPSGGGVFVTYCNISFFDNQFTRGIL